MIRLFVIAFLLIAGSVWAKPEELEGRVSASKPAGCADIRFLFLDLYRAELWTDTRRLPGRQFGLSLVYRTGFSREALIESSIGEMERISGRPDASFEAVRRDLETAFRDVTAGDRITAWHEGPNRAVFFVNGQLTGPLDHDVALFFEIWLGPESRNPAGRAKLLEGRCDDD